MIPFDRLELKISSDAFIGIKKENNEYIFYLPKGFDEYIDKFSVIELKELFFNFYKLFKKHQNTKPKDGVDNSKGIGGENKKDTPIFYGSLNIDEIISNFDKISILGFTSKHIKGDEIDYSKIGEYLDEVNYTKDNIPILTEPILKPKNIINISPQEIVNMYCFIYFDIKTQLNEEIAEYIKSLGFKFRDKYLFPNASFFNGIDISNECKDILEKIDRNSLQTDEYLEFFDSVYRFLYFDTEGDGVVAGIDNFYSIWEDICFNYMFKYFKDDILYADYEKKANLKLNEYTRMYAKDKENYPFKMSFGADEKYIYPDLIYFDNQNIQYYEIIEENNEDSFDIIKNGKIKIPKLSSYKYLGKNCIQISVNNNSYYILDYIYGSSNQIKSIKIFKNDIKKTDFYKKNIFNGNELNKENYKKELKNVLNKIKNKKYSGYEIIDEFYDCIKFYNILIDFKYKTKEEIDKTDKVKQKFYEIALKNEKKIENKFVLPKYSKEKRLIVNEDKIDSLKIEYWNFRLLLEEYL